MRSTAGKIVLALLATGVAVPAPPDAPPVEPSLEGLHWLAGHWKGDFDGVPFEAVYTSPEGGTILSTSKLYSENGAVTFFEFERFWIEGGQVVYQPHPGGRAADRFRLAADSRPAERSASFIAPQNDFPTRITFASPQADRLTITLQGPRADEGPVQRVHLRRVSP